MTYRADSSGGMEMASENMCVIAGIRADSGHPEGNLADTGEGRSVAISEAVSDTTASKSITMWIPSALMACWSVDKTASVFTAPCRRIDGRVQCVQHRVSVYYSCQQRVPAMPMSEHHNQTIDGAPPYSGVSLITAFRMVLPYAIRIVIRN